MTNQHEWFTDAVGEEMAVLDVVIANDPHPYRKSVLGRLKDRLLTLRSEASGEAGAARIDAERRRQVEVEGWTPEHDDIHADGSLVFVAISYLFHAVYGRSKREVPSFWPESWARMWWKPSDDPIRNYEKAGALIAAEIDRLQRAARRGEGGGA